MSLVLNRTSRQSFYFVEVEPKPISVQNWSLFAKAPAQRKILEIIDRLHSQKRVGSTIEFDEIEVQLNKASGNYLRRNIIKEPLSHFIREVDFYCDDKNANRAKCYTLDYEALSSDKTLKELLAENAKKNAVVMDSMNPGSVLQENKVARDKYGYSKQISAEVSFTTESMTNLIRFAENTDKKKVTKRLPSTDSNLDSFCTIKTANKRIVSLADVVVIIACANLTYAYHKYRLNYYLQNKTKPLNETPISLSALRKLLERPRTSDVNNSLRQSLDITRDTTFDFTQEVYSEHELNRKEPRNVRYRYFECDAILNDMPDSEAEAEKVFHSANIFVLKWDVKIFNSIVESDSVFALPDGSLSIEPALVVLYIKLRGIAYLKLSKATPTKQATYEPIRFLREYLNLSKKEFLALLRKASRKKSLEGLSIEDDNGEVTLSLFGYTLLFSFKSSSLLILADKKAIHGYLGIKDGFESPTASNEVSLALRNIIEEDEEVNARFQRTLSVERKESYCLISDGGASEFVLTAYTSDSDLEMLATVLLSSDQKRAELLEELVALRGECNTLCFDDTEVTLATLNHVRNEVVFQMRLDHIIDINLITRHLAENSEDLQAVVISAAHHLDLPYETLQNLANLTE